MAKVWNKFHTPVKLDAVVLQDKGTFLLFTMFYQIILQFCTDYYDYVVSYDVSDHCEQCIKMNVG
jgi:hypothetical protein